MRILHAPSDAAHQAWTITRELQALGHHADVWHQIPDGSGAPADRTVPANGDPVRAVATLFEVLDGFDVVHFHGGPSFLGPETGVPASWDLPVLRALGKKIVFTYRDGAADLSIVRTYADRITAQSVLDLPSVPDAVYVPLAVDVSDDQVTALDHSDRPIVVHVSPPHGSTGSAIVVAGLGKLERRGFSFELRVVTPATHDELRKQLTDANVVVDDLDSGDLGIVTLEAMAIGKPVVTRIRSEVRARHRDLPAVEADPLRIVEAVEPLLRDAELRRRLGRQGRTYVEKNHAAAVVVAMLLPLYEEPAKPISRVHPGWMSHASASKLAGYEQALQRLNARAVDLDRRLRQRDSARADLSLLYRDSLPVRTLRLLRRKASDR